MQENVNLEFLKKSRKRLKPGDIFVIKPKGHDYCFGRVISVTSDCGFKTFDSVLIYVYNATSKNKNKIPELKKENLLIPPTMLNRLGWSRGYFENVAYIELLPEDVFETNCFWTREEKPYDAPAALRKIIYMDDKGNQLKGPVEPVGLFGLGNYRTLDDEVGDALGIPLAPD